jgi:hypothetical protein
MAFGTEVNQPINVSLLKLVLVNVLWKRKTPLKGSGV